MKTGKDADADKGNVGVGEGVGVGVGVGLGVGVGATVGIGVGDELSAPPQPARFEHSINAPATAPIFRKRNILQHQIDRRISVSIS